jgi:predicted transcriptional regulator
VRDFFHRIGNYIDTLDRMAEANRQEIGGDAFTLCETLSRRLVERHGIRVSFNRSATADVPHRRFDPQSLVLELDGFADRSSNTFALAHQLALLEAHEAIETVVRSAAFHSPGASAVCRVALGNYYAGSVMMPYTEFLQAARRYRHDLDMLTRLFGASIEQVAHRLSTMQRPGAQGVPFFFLRVDRAGNITKRHSATRLSFARYGGACPLWNVHEAFEAPDRLLVQVAEMPDGVQYLSLAQAITKSGVGRGTRRRYAIGLGCELADAGEVIYSDDLNIEDARSVVAIGVSCRLCERADCSQRAFPPIGRSISIDPNVRRAVPYIVDVD